MDTWDLVWRDTCSLISLRRVLLIAAVFRKMCSFSIGLKNSERGKMLRGQELLFAVDDSSGSYGAT